MFKGSEIFFFSATLHWQKEVKEIAYILTCYPDVKSAIFLFIYSLNKGQ